MEKTFDIVALGEAMIEFNQTHIDQPHYLQGFGGDTSNAVIAAARAGASTTYLTRLGADHFGDELIALWQREGVDCAHIERDSAAHTGVYFVNHDRSGHAFSYLRAGSAASRMTPQWVQKDHIRQRIEGSQFLHVSGISLGISPSACATVLAAMDLARKADTQIAFDSNLRLKLWSPAEARPHMEQAMGLCDLFLPSMEDMTLLTGLTDADAVIRWSHQKGARIVVLKLGSKGALVSDGKRCESIPVKAVDVVDATGAGDCFCGNLLARLAKGDNLFDAANYANAAASIAVQGFGAVAPLPTQEQVQALM